MGSLGRPTREKIVFALAAVPCVGFALLPPGFPTADNLLNLARSVSIVGILGVATEAIPLTA